uniref:Defense protein l(2)34Fc n=1 Tax=Ceratitis capitata TaxID=7213 RepID=W8B6M1_CERCA
MLRLLVIAFCLAAPIHSLSSTTFPEDFCSHGNVEHYESPATETLPKAATVDEPSNTSHEKFQLRLSGGHGAFSGFAIQAQDPNGAPVGKFQIVDGYKSRTTTCRNSDDTILHTEAQQERPLKSVDFSWIPAGYQGNVRFVATLAKEDGPWVRRTLKEINV